MFLSARELHIRLVVSDVDAIAGLEHAAAELKQRALQARDRRVEFACVQAHDRILAIATAYKELQSIDLEQPAEVSQSLPDLCASLCACLDYPRPALALASEGALDCFSVLNALTADGAVGDLVEESVRRGADQQGCAVSFALERDAAGDWVISTTNGEPGAEDDTVEALNTRLTEWKQAVARWINQRLTRLAPTAS